MYYSIYLLYYLGALNVVMIEMPSLLKYNVDVQGFWHLRYDNFHSNAPLLGNLYNQFLWYTCRSTCHSNVPKLISMRYDVKMREASSDWDLWQPLLYLTSTMLSMDLWVWVSLMGILNIQKCNNYFCLVSECSVREVPTGEVTRPYKRVKSLK